MNPYLTRATNMFGDNFRSNMLYTTFTNVEVGGRSYRDTKRLFTPAQRDLGAGTSGSYFMGTDWGLFKNDTDRIAKIGNNSMAYWTRSPYDAYQGSNNIVGMQTVMSNGKIDMRGNAMGSMIGARPATNYDSDTLVQLQDDGRYMFIWN